MRPADARAHGNVLKTLPSVLADRIAWKIIEYATPRAVTLDPDGRVWIEPLDEVAECDLVGVYTRGAGGLALASMIRADLKAAMAERGWK